MERVLATMDFDDRCPSVVVPSELPAMARSLPQTWDDMGDFFCNFDKLLSTDGSYMEGTPRSVVSVGSAASTMFYSDGEVGLDVCLLAATHTYACSSPPCPHITHRRKRLRVCENMHTQMYVLSRKNVHTNVLTSCVFVCI